jgi:uncharacterized membrane protein YebE (DUF533 family)
MIVVSAAAWLLWTIGRAVLWLLTHPKITLPLAALAGLAWLTAPIAGTLRTLAPYIIGLGTIAGLGVVAYALVTDYRANRTLDAELAREAAAGTVVAAYAPPERRWWEEDGE